MTNDFDKWNKLKKETDFFQSSVKIREGEVRWCKIGINIGFEALGKGENFHRPVLIIKKYSGDSFLGLPLTSKNKKGNWYYRLEYQTPNQTIILNQGRIFDRRRLEEKMFEISETELVNIKRAYCLLIMKSD